jgi:hypothetical protein
MQCNVFKPGKAQKLPDWYTEPIGPKIPPEVISNGTAAEI